MRYILYRETADGKVYQQVTYRRVSDSYGNETRIPVFEDCHKEAATVFSEKSWVEFIWFVFDLEYEETERYQ